MFRGKREREETSYDSGKEGIMGAEPRGKTDQRRKNGEKRIQP